MRIRRTTQTPTNISNQGNSPNGRTVKQKKATVITPTTPADFPLVNKLRNIAGSNLTKKQATELKRAEIQELSKVIAEMKMDDSSLVDVTKRLEKKFEKLDTDLYAELKKQFKASDYPEKRIILSMYMLLGKGFSPFIGSVLEKGKKDKDYDFCMQFLKALDEPDIQAFIYNMDFSNINNLNRLVTSMLEVTDERLILDTLESNISRAVSEGRFGENPLDRKLKILNTVMKNCKEELELPEVAFLYRFADSWENLEAAFDLLIEKFKKQDVEDFFLGYATVEDQDHRGRATSIVHYAKLKGLESMDLLKNFIYENDHPVFVTSACIGLIAYCGDKGLTEIEQAIETDIENGNPSLVLASIVVNSKNNPSYDDLLKKLFSKKWDLTSAFHKIANSELKTAYRGGKWACHEVIKPSFPKMATSIGFDNGRLFDWMIKGETETLRQNSKDFVLAALSKDKKERFSKMIGRFHAEGGKNAELLRTWIGM